MHIERIELPSSNYGSKTATLTAYVQDNLADQATRRRPAVVVCPGGCYERCSDRESEPIALALLARGLQSFVLDYAVLEPDVPTPLLPAPQVDLAHAVATVRARAGEWHVDEGSVGLLGCSAGAHLAATYTALMLDDAFLARADVPAERARADWQILCYPAVDLDLGWLSDPAAIARICPESSPLRRAQDLVSDATPPTFLWHTAVDATVPVRNSYLYAAALAARGVDHECHVFHAGRHGLSLATPESEHYPGDVVPHVARWLDLAVEWLGELPLT